MLNLYFCVPISKVENKYWVLYIYHIASHFIILFFIAENKTLHRTPSVFDVQ